MKKLVLMSVLTFIILFNSLATLEANALYSNENAEEYNSLREQLDNLLINEKGTYGIYLIDVTTGKTMGINHLENFHAASTLKLPINLYLYEKIAQGEVSPGAHLVYKEEHYEGGTGSLQFNEIDSSYRIDLLSKYSIIYSDNVALNIIYNYLGPHNVKNYMREIGGLVVENTNSNTCPRDMAIYMYRLLEMEREYPEIAGVLINHLEESVFKDRIPAQLPQDVKIANKTGDWPASGTYNDVGYVQHPNRPYILSVQSKNTASRERAYQVLQQISKMVWDFQSSKPNYDVSVQLNNVEINFPDQQPYIDTSMGRTYVPVRFISEALGAKVDWVDNSVVIEGEEAEVRLNIGNRYPLIDGLPLDSPLDAPAILINERTMVPLRFVSEVLDYPVKFDSSTNTVVIKKVFNESLDAVDN